VPEITNTEYVTLPLDYYKPTSQQAATIEVADAILTRDCMRRFGLDWPVQNVPVDNSPSKLWGISNAADVAKWGYHPNPSRYNNGKPDGTTDTKQPSAAWQEVAMGGPQSYQKKQIPKGGCVTEARAKVGFNVTPASVGFQMRNLVMDLANHADVAAQSDPRTLELWGKWSACMKKSGYDYRGPWDANDDPAWAASGDVPSQREIATATADLRCRNSMNFAGVSDAIETAYQNQLIEQNAEALRAEKVKVDNQVKLATQLVAQGH
jgi:hypothetical protein